MPGEEFEHGAQHGGIPDAAAQFVRGKPGQGEETLGAVVALQQPAERAERQGLRIDRGWRFTENCQALSQRLVQPEGHSGDRKQVAKRILVVEDNDLNRKLFCDVLVSQGFVVEPVADGHQVIARARDFVPNLIIMDIQLAEVSGVELIEKAKADVALRHIPVLAVTAYAGKGDEERIRDAGAEGYLAKPVSIGPFLAAVRGLLEKATA